MLYVRIVFLIGVVCLLQACDKRKTPITGKRENVLLSGDALNPHPDLAKEKIVLSKPVLNNWQQPGGGDEDHRPTHVKLRDQLKKAWDIRIGPASGGIRRMLSPPIVHKDTIYTLNAQGFIVANRTKDGRELWKLNTCPRRKADGGLGGGISYHKGRLYVSTPYAEIIAVDPATKEILWRKELETPSRAAPTIYQDRLFILTVSNILICADIKTGQEIWAHRGMLETAGLLGGASVAIADNMVVAPYTSGEVYGLHMMTGDVFWAESLSSFGRVDSIASLPHIHARPVIQNGIAYLISHSGRSAAIDVKTGDIVWEQNFGGSETPVVSGNTLYMVAADQVLLALERSTGRVRWTTPLQQFQEPEKAKGYIVWKGPVLAGGKLVLTSSHGRLLLVNAYTGKIQQNIALDEGSSIEPIVAGETLYVLTNNGRLIAYR